MKGINIIYNPMVDLLIYLTNNIKYCKKKFKKKKEEKKYNFNITHAR